MTVNINLLWLSDLINALTGLQRTRMYVEECGYYDNGRLRTWLPYNKNQDSSALVHDISQEKLLGDQVDKYYTFWYRGPQVSFEIKVTVPYFFY